MDWPFPPARYIDHDRDFRPLVDQLSQEPIIAVDTESNGLYAYRERICLIQISTRSADYILDPLRIADLSPLGAVLAEPTIEKVFHAAEYDLMSLKRDYGFTVSHLFDTMAAARICGIKAIGLDKLLARYCGVSLDKRHQRDDWGRRPLSEENLLYAQMDTHYLLALRDHLEAELAARGFLEEAQETFSLGCQVPAASRDFDPDGYWRIGIPHDFNRRQMAMLRELYLLREQIAQERDCPPFKVFNDGVMAALVEAAPATTEQLGKVKGMTPAQVSRYGRQVLRALEQGRRAPAPKPPKPPPDADPVVVERFAALRNWRRGRAEQRGVESDVIISREALWALALRAPAHLDDLHTIRELGPWRIATYGQEILDVLQRPEAWVK